MKLRSIGILVIALTMVLVSIPFTAVAAGDPGEVWVGDESKGALNHATIQEAIDAVAVGGTVNVCAGTYFEQLVINKAVNVMGAGNETTIIDGTDVVITQGGLVRITGIATGTVTLDGFTIRNAPFNGTQQFIIVAANCDVESTLSITNNILLGSGGQPPDGHFDFGFYSSRNKGALLFSNNEVSGVYGNSLLFELHTGPAEISYNTITAIQGTSIFSMSYKSGDDDNDVTGKQFIHHNIIDTNGRPGIAFSSAYGSFYNERTNGKYTDLEISDNTIFNLTNAAAGIQLQETGDDGGFISPVISGNRILNKEDDETAGGNAIVLVGAVADAQITANEISCKGHGIYLLGKWGVWNSAPYPTNALIDGNIITGAARAVRVYAGTTAINGNLIVDSTVGVTNHTSELIDAANNWWGSDLEPDQFVGNVDYSPWALNESFTAFGSRCDIGDEFDASIPIELTDENYITIDSRATSIDGQTLTFLSEGEMQLELPVSILPSEAGLSVTISRLPSDAPEGFRLLGYVFSFTIVDSDNEPVSFSGNMTITFFFDPEEVADLENLDVYWFDGDEWVAQGGIVNTTNNTVTIQVNHWSDFALMGEVVETLPVTGTNIMWIIPFGLMLLLLGVWAFYRRVMV